MNKTQKLLAIARWAHPLQHWVTIHDGSIVNVDLEVFDLADRKCRQAVEMKLREAGWKIYERKRQGQVVWEAVTKDGGFAESPSYVALIYGLISGK